MSVHGMEVTRKLTFAVILHVAAISNMQILARICLQY